MKLMVLALLTLFGVVTAAANAGPDGSAPVDRIVKMLSSLQESIGSDSKNEDKVYNKYACFCETTSKRKADDIASAHAEMRELGQQILKLKGSVATDTAVMAELSQDISDLDDRVAQRTAIRQKENGRYMSEAAEAMEALASLQQAITTLSDTTKSMGSALLQSVATTQSRSAVADVLNKLPSRIASLPAERMVLLSDFAKMKTGYAPQSATLQGMLVDMYTNFAKGLEESTSDEASHNAQFEQADAVDAKAKKHS